MAFGAVMGATFTFIAATFVVSAMMNIAPSEIPQEVASEQNVITITISEASATSQNSGEGTDVIVDRNWSSGSSSQSVDVGGCSGNYCASSSNDFATAISANDSAYGQTSEGGSYVFSGAAYGHSGSASSVSWNNSWRN